MRKVYTLKYVKKIFAQRYYDPDTGDDVAYLNEDDETELPIIDDAEVDEILEDSFDEEQIGGEIVDEPPQVPITDQDFPEFRTSAEALTYAQQNAEVIRIYYTTRRGRDLVRDVEPQGQFMAQTTRNHIVVTFDKTVGDMRAFIVNNISYYIFVGEKHDYNRQPEGQANV